MKNTTNLLLLFLLITCSAFAQDFRFGKVSKEEVSQKKCPIDSSANAAYLYKSRRSYINYTENKGFHLITEIFERIKIYDADGFDHATQIISLYKSDSRSDSESYSGLKAYTYNLVGGKLEEIKLKNDGIFEEEVSKYRDHVKITMPNISVGSVIDIKYRVESPFLSNVDDFVLQTDIPIMNLEASFKSPEYFNYKINARGYLPISPNLETGNEKITFASKAQYGNSYGAYSGTGTTSRSDVDFRTNKYSFNLKDIPALRDEPYVGNIDNYRSTVKFELSYTQFPQSTVTNYSTTWEDVVKTIYKNDSFGSELNKSGYYDDDIDQLLASATNELEKIALIFGYVRNHMSWNGYYGKFTDNGVKRAYKERSGNVAEINLMLTSMMRYAGLESYPVLVSTRSNGIPLFPTIDGYNYVIASVKSDNGFVLLDATSKFSTPNVLPTRTLNWEGRVIRNDGSSTTVNLYPSIKAKNTVSAMVTLDEQGSINGSIRTVFSNHNALKYREKYIGAEQESFIQSKENTYGGMEIEEFKVANDLDFSKPVMETYSFTKESQAEVIGDKIYFSPLFFMRDLENPFKLEKREFPIDFGYPSGSKYMINVVIPEGYEVESIPEPVAFSLPDNLGTFKFKITEGANSSVQLMMESDINSSLIPANYYKSIKTFFQEMVDKENEKVVLKKV